MPADGRPLDGARVWFPGPLSRGRQAVDGRELLAAAVDFSRELRAAGLPVDLGAVIDFGRALTLVGLADRAAVREAGAALFVRHREDREVYDRVFERFWRSMQAASRPALQAQLLGVEATPVAEAPTERPGSPADEPETAASTSPARPGRQSDGGADDGEFDAVVVSEMAYSRGQVDRHRDFERMSSSELREAERFIDLLAPRLELRRTRRRELGHRGRLLAPRAMLRRNLKTGGDPLDWVWQRPRHRPRSLVVLCDISGSMERHARLLLRFAQALAASEVRTEAFVFGTRLTRVTRLLRDRDRDRALRRVAEATTDWSGGTRIGESFREFNRTWARRVLRSSSIVVVVSDGWDRGDPALVALETARLRRACHRLIWLNPLAGAPGYEPLAGGMAAALPSVDRLVPAGTLASLEQLALLLAGSDRAADLAWGGGSRGPGDRARSAPSAGNALGARSRGVAA